MAQDQQTQHRTTATTNGIAKQTACTTTQHAHRTCARRPIEQDPARRVNPKLFEPELPSRTSGLVSTQHKTKAPDTRQAPAHTR
eukprot:2445834-Rhodomonas_salina.1